MIQILISLFAKKNILFVITFLLAVLALNIKFTSKTYAMVIDTSGIPQSYWIHDQDLSFPDENVCKGAKTEFGGGDNKDIYSASNAIWVSPTDNSAASIVQIPVNTNSISLRLNGIIGWCRSNMLDGANNPFPFHSTPFTNPTSIPQGYTLPGAWCSAWCSFKINDRSLQKVSYAEIQATSSGVTPQINAISNKLAIDVSQSYLNNESVSNPLDAGPDYVVAEDSFYVKGVDAQGNYNYGNAPNAIIFQINNLNTLAQGQSLITLNYSYVGLTEYIRDINGVPTREIECRNKIKSPNGLDQILKLPNESDLSGCARDSGTLVFQVFKQSNPPSAVLSAVCDASGNVTVRATSIKDLDNSNLTLRINYKEFKNGAIIDGTQTANLIKTSGGIFNDYTFIPPYIGPRNNQPYKITGTINDGLQTINLTEVSVTCQDAISCTLENIVVENGTTITPKMNITTNTGIRVTSATLTLKDITPEYKLTYNTLTDIGNPPGVATINFANVNVSTITGVYGIKNYTFIGTMFFTTDGRTTQQRNCFSELDNLRIVKRPVFKIYNGDVSVGTNFQNTFGVCTPKTSATGIVVDSWANISTGGISHGSSTQYAARLFAESINNFYTYSINQSLQPKGKALTLANTANTYGNNIGSGNCIRNFFATRDATKSNTIQNWSGVNSNDDLNSDGLPDQYYINGNLTIDSTKTFNNNVAVYVDGDVVIKNNILLNSNYTFTADTAKRLKVPFFGIVAKGNIYIDPTVNQLDGLYVAQPLDDNTKGIINTCSRGTSGISLTDSTYYSSCGGNEVNMSTGGGIKFNGYVAAKELELRRIARTFSTAGDSYKTALNNSIDSTTFNGTNFKVDPTNYAAEIFYGLPELNLADNPLNLLTESANQSDSAESLPPLL